MKYYPQRYKQLFQTYPQENKDKANRFVFLPRSNHIFLLESTYRDIFLLN